MGNDPSALIDSVKFEKMLLAKKVGQFLAMDQIDEERAAVETVARQLAFDVSVTVRRILAYELRHCTTLVPDLADKIAKDVEAVSGPFLAVTVAISTKAWLRLLPQLEDYALAVLARRSDLSTSVVQQLVQIGSEQSMTALVRNDTLILDEPACITVVDRFSNNIYLMDQLSARIDLPTSIVERIADHISDHCRAVMIEHYSLGKGVAAKLVNKTRAAFLFDQLRGADDDQVHACVMELRANRRLTQVMTLEMATKGCLSFLESALALDAGLPRGRVKEILTLSDQPAFVNLMKMASISKAMAPRFLKVIKSQYRSNMAVT